MRWDRAQWCRRGRVFCVIAVASSCNPSADGQEGPPHSSRPTGAGSHVRRPLQRHLVRSFLPKTGTPLRYARNAARVGGMHNAELIVALLLRCSMRPLIVVALVFVTGCSHAGDSQSTRSDERGGRQNTEAVPVSTAIVMEKPVPLDVPAVGTGEAISSVQIRSQVTGQLAAIHFAEGQDVTQGQLLFELDPRPFQLALAQAEAVLAPAAAPRCRRWIADLADADALCDPRVLHLHGGPQRAAAVRRARSKSRPGSRSLRPPSPCPAPRPTRAVSESCARRRRCSASAGP